MHISLVARKNQSMGSKENPIYMKKCTLKYRGYTYTYTTSTEGNKTHIHMYVSIQAKGTRWALLYCYYCFYYAHFQRSIYTCMYPVWGAADDNNDGKSKQTHANPLIKELNEQEE